MIVGLRSARLRLGLVLGFHKDKSMRIAMKALLKSFVTLLLLMASLLFQPPVMALSTHSTQPHPLLGAQSEKITTSTQDTGDKLQSTIGSVTGEGGQNLKKGSKQAKADDGNQVDRIAKELLDEDAAQVEKPDKSR
jgi:hypothetical protein